MGYFITKNKGKLKGNKMAWRPSQYVVDGELDNTIPNKVTGHINFVGGLKVEFNLKGNFHRDIRGSKIKIIAKNPDFSNVEEAENYMQVFAKKQTVDVGDMTAGIATGKNEQGEDTYEYVSYPYFEWYGKANGRVVLELDCNEIELITSPIPVLESNPINRETQSKLMGNFLQDMSNALGITAVAVSGKKVIVKKARKNGNKNN